MRQETAQEIIDSQFFIDPEGKVCKYIVGDDDVEEIISVHAAIAEQLFGHLNIDDPETYMMDLGWILVGSCVYHQPIIHKYPTQAQINTLDALNLYNKLAFLHNNHYPNFVLNETTARLYL